MGRKTNPFLISKAFAIKRGFFLRMFIEEKERVMKVICLHTYRDGGCMTLAFESKCPMFTQDSRCFGCINTDFNRLIPVQGGTEGEKSLFRNLLSAAGTVG